MKKFELLFLFLCFAFPALSSEVCDDVGSAIRAGDAKQVASYFNVNIDLTLINQEDVYSKAQAELLVKDFFIKNAPKSFSIAHKVSSHEGTLFAIGTLVTVSGKTYRVSFTLKNSQGKYVLQELRFEPQ